ncbi:MAG: hypothetical protein ACRCWB_10100 [Enterovibrio sp.]
MLLQHFAGKFALQLQLAGIFADLHFINNQSRPFIARWRECNLAACKDFFAIFQVVKIADRDKRSRRNCKRVGILPCRAQAECHKPYTMAQLRPALCHRS